MACEVECPTGGVDEGEACGSDTNGGCLDDPPPFTSMTLGVTYCGMGWADSSIRDTDWYELVTTESMVLTLTAEAEFGTLGMLTGFVETVTPGSGDCADTTGYVGPYAIVGECEEAVVVTECVPAGTYWPFVAPSTWGNLPCDSNNDYVIKVTGVSCVLPTGACCYSDGSCTPDMTEAACVADGGDYWGDDTVCSPNPCPQPTPGDDCDSPNQVTDTFTDTNTTCGRGNDYADTCLGSYDGGEDMIYEWTVTADGSCFDITFDPKGTTWTGLAIDDVCPLDSGYSDCLEKSTSSSGSARMISGVMLDAGTYYIMIDTYPSPDCIPEFDLTVVECPPPPPNDDCEDAVAVSVPGSETVNVSAATDDITDPCGVYSGPWKNVWYTVTGTGNTMTATTCTAGTEVSDTKISVFCGDCDYQICVDGNDDDCDDYGSYLSTVSWCSEAGVTYYVTAGMFSSTTTPGVIQIDFSDDGTTCTGAIDCTIPTGACCVGDVCSVVTESECGDLGGMYLGDDVPCDPNPCGSGACCEWPSGDCQEVSFDDCNALGAGWTFLGGGTSCTPNPCPTPGDDCSAPMTITVGLADLPYVDTNTNCGRGYDYSSTCLGYYDGGEDIIYELIVTEAMDVDILVDPKGTTWTGIAIDTVCPPSSSCLAYDTSSSSAQHGIEGLHLEPGTYYIMIDTWPSPYCIPEFDLIIKGPCILECPTGASIEGEACGADTNGGCNMMTPTFEPINVGDTVCGLGWAEYGTRDTDWYEVVVTADTQLTWTVEAEFEVVIGFVETDPLGSGDCADSTGYLSPYAVTPKCEPASVSMCVPPGTYWVFVAPADFYDLPCDSNNDYVATLTGEDCPEGACCVGDGTCAITNAIQCAGIWLGEGTVCSPNPCPENDACAGAEKVDVPGTGTGDTTNAASDIEVPCGVYSGPWKNVWYEVTGTGNTMTADLCGGADWDTKISVFCGHCMYQICVDGDDDGCRSLQSEVSWCSEDGVIYYVTVGGYSISKYGPFTLNVSDDGTPCTGAVDCTVPSGACCVDEGLTVACYVVHEYECVDLGGVYLGDDTDCTPDPSDPCDCQPNGVFDPEDIAGGTSEDCNGNGVPDECDVADGYSDDCQNDGIPDECQLDERGSKDVLLSEGFEGGVIPPAGWTAVVNNAFTWELGDYNPYEGMYYATCYYDEYYTGVQDEWIVSGSLNAVGTATLSGYSMGSYYWGIDPYNNYDLEAWVIIGAGVNDGDDILLGQIDEDTWPTTSWTWVPFSYSFTAPAGAFRVAFRYSGYDGAQAGLDAVLLEGMAGAPPNDCNMNGIPDECDIATEDGGYCPYVVGQPCSADCQPNGIPDECDIAEGTSEDPDMDGIPSECDNCPNDVNVGQEDTDADCPDPLSGAECGDACDPCTDIDEDGWGIDVGNGIDCPNGTDPDCDEGNTTDPDVDNVCNPYDNCPNTYNPDQLDSDDDGYGNACENCPFDPWKLDPLQCGCNLVDPDWMAAFNVEKDTDSDGIADCCDECPDGEWDPYFEASNLAGNTCEPYAGCEDAIPTVSQWGLIVMALLLLVAGKIYFGRRSATA